MREGVRLLGDEELAASSVVANNAMNRGRGIASYSRELGFDVPGFLAERVAAAGAARWLDLCCGSGRALVEAAGLLPGVEIVGVDLVDFFAEEAPPGVRWVVSGVEGVAGLGLGEFDLVTCVHGLHYVGDKLGALRTAVAAVGAGGRFAASLDVAALRGGDGEPLGRKASAALRAAGFGYDGRRRRVSWTGAVPGAVAVEGTGWPWRYAGADDRAGANYTGQEAVDSYYV